MKNLIKLSIVGASLVAAGASQAVDVNVGAVIPAYCNLTLGNGSSGTANIAFEATQNIANFDLSCNTPGGATLTVEAQNADFWNDDNSNILVNYALSLDADIDDFDIAETDASPGSKVFSSSLSSYSAQLADGIGATFYLNLNVDAPGPTPLGQTYFPATSAPAGSYSESFTFTIAGL